MINRMKKDRISKKLGQLKYVILHEDEHHLVINKPAGMGCIPDRRDMGRKSLLEHLTEKYPTARLVHRLDVTTSGVVLVALSTDSMRHLSEQFQNREVHKEYITFVNGFTAFEELTISKPVGPILRKGETTIRRKGKDSITHIKRLRNLKGYSKLSCAPQTGRTHQIRIHLSDMGLPIVADEKYGGQLPFLSKIKKNYNRSKRNDDRAESPLLTRVALHAANITYTPFQSDQTLTLSAEPPSDMLKFEEKLEKFA
jgi:RluA family pseudouridine synthase